jgi:predicted RNase H-like HicB family nuclease
MYPMTPSRSFVAVLHDRNAEGRGRVSQYLAVIERDGEAWGAYVPDLQGCVAVGQTREEVEKLITEAIPLHIASMREQGELVPAPAAVDISKVIVTPT